MEFSPKPSIDADKLVADVRENFPDLTADEEANIRSAVATGQPVYLRCRFTTSDGRGFRFGETPLVTIDQDIR